MQVHHGIYNDQYHLAPSGEDSPLNVDVAGRTRPVTNFQIFLLNPIADASITFYQMEYVLSGKAHIEVENKTYTAEKGDFFFINKGTPRILSTDKNSPVEKLFVTAKGPFLDGIVKAYKLESPYITAKADVEKYFRNIINILEEAPEYTPVERDKIGGEILSILQTVSRELHLVDNTVEKSRIPESILKYIDANLNRKLTIEELEQNFFLGKTQLIKVFKNKYGVTPMKYAQTQRIELAKYYLEKSDTPILRLHELLGFEGAKYFSRQFKKLTGISPQEYRYTKRKLTTPEASRKFEMSLRKHK